MKFFSAIILMLVSGAVLGAVPTDNALNEIVIGYKNASGTWEPIIKSYAYRLFWLLVAIDFSWGAIQLAIEKSEFESFWGFVINRVMTYGFFLALLSFGSTWSKTIIDSLRQLAGAAGGMSALNPSDVLDQGLSIAVKLIDAVSGVWNLGGTIIAGILAIFILLTFALIAAELVFVLVSMWIMLYAGIIMLAFGGSTWTRDYAINYYKTILAIGVKLFVIQLIIGIGTTIINGWSSSVSPDPKFAEMFVIAGGVLVLYVLVKGIGGLVESLISGSGAASTSGSGAIAAGAAAGAAVVASMASAGASAGQSAAGASQAISAASSLQSMSSNGPSSIAQSMANIGEKIGGEKGGSIGSSLGGAFDKVAGTVKEAASAYGTDYSARARGDASAQHGTTGGRMGNIMNDKMAEMAASGGGDDSSSNGDGDREDSNYVSGVSS